MKRIRVLDIVLFVVFVLVLTVLSYPWTIRPAILTWGATDDEVAQPLPSDGLLSDAEIQTTRAITIDAEPDAIWEWLPYVGSDRMRGEDGANMRITFFSEERSERILRLLFEATEMDTLRFVDGDADSIAVVGVRPDEFTLRIAEPHDADDRLRVTWSFNVAPQDDGTSRLVVRTRIAYDGDHDNLMWVAVVEPALFVAERSIMRAIRDRSEAGLVPR